MQRGKKADEGGGKEEMSNQKSVHHPCFTFNYEGMNLQALTKWEPALLRNGFVYEQQYYLGHPVYQPWESFAEIQSGIWSEWMITEAELDQLFKNRMTKNVKPLMERGLVLFLSLLFWSNGKPVNLHQYHLNIEQLDAKPVNIDERLGFVLKRPEFYPSYMQLKSLMEEQKKSAAKLAAIKKPSK